jgi:hypothetical protein
MAGQILGMNKKQLQRECNKDFCARILDKFKEWTLKKGKHPTMENFAVFLIRHGLIEELTINRFLTIQYYAEELPKTKTPRRPNGVKMQAIWNIEDKLPLMQRQIRSNLCHHAHDFHDKPSRFVS